MASLSDYSNEELGRMLRQASSGREDEAMIAMQSQYSLAQFFEEAGLYILAELIWEAASVVYEGIKSFFRSLFY